MSEGTTIWISPVDGEVVEFEPQIGYSQIEGRHVRDSFLLTRGGNRRFIIERRFSQMA